VTDEVLNDWCNGFVETPMAASRESIVVAANTLLHRKNCLLALIMFR
jgi:hypothetical protein